MTQLLILDRKNTRLDAEGRHLVIRHEGLDRPRCLPLAQIGQVVAIGRIETTTTVLSRLAGAGIGFLGLPGGRGDQAWFQTGDCGGNTRRRLQQVQMLLDERLCDRHAARLVQARIRAQARLLQKVAQEDARFRLQAGKAVLQLHALSLRTTGLPSNRLLGLEGAASSLYFRCYSQLFPESWAFHGRNRRPPRDPVNALLSLSYTMLTSLAIQALRIQGLDPEFGFYHKPGYYRPSLACDLVELARAPAERWVLRLCREAVLRPRDFASDGEACLLSKSGRSIYYSHWAREAEYFRRFLLRIAAAWRRRVDPTGGTDHDNSH
jgi:CRISPR-associated protein Cas1